MAYIERPEDKENGCKTTIFYTKSKIRGQLVKHTHDTIVHRAICATGPMHVQLYYRYLSCNLATSHFIVLSPLFAFPLVATNLFPPLLPVQCLNSRFRTLCGFILLCSHSQLLRKAPFFALLFNSRTSFTQLH